MQYSGSLDSAHDANSIQFCPNLETCPKWNKTHFETDFSKSEAKPQTTEVLPILSPEGSEFLSRFIDKLQEENGNKELEPVDREQIVEALRQTPFLRQELMENTHIRTLFDLGLLRPAMLGDIVNTEQTMAYYRRKNAWKQMPQPLKFSIILGLSPIKTKDLKKIEQRARIHVEDEFMDALEIPKVSEKDVLHGHFMTTLKKIQD